MSALAEKYERQEADALSEAQAELGIDVTELPQGFDRLPRVHKPLGLLPQRKLLGQLVREGPPPPSFLPSPTLGERLFYEEHLWIISGHKKSGKSWAMAAT